MNENENIITLTDEEGNEVEFEVLDIVIYQGEDYIVLLENTEEADEVVILKVGEADEDGDETYLPVDDEETLNDVFDLFKARFEDEFSFEE